MEWLDTDEAVFMWADTEEIVALCNITNTGYKVEVE